MTSYFSLIGAAPLSPVTSARVESGGAVVRVLHLFEEDRRGRRRRVDAQDAGDLHHLEDLLRSGAVPDGVLDVQLETLDVEMGRGRVEGDVDELLDLRLEGARTPGRRGEVRVGGVLFWVLFVFFVFVGVFVVLCFGVFCLVLF